MAETKDYAAVRVRVGDDTAYEVHWCASYVAGPMQLIPAQTLATMLNRHTQLVREERLADLPLASRSR